ncbi:hypothetical protein D3C83_116130 [compost metagenome]
MAALSSAFASGSRTAAPCIVKPRSPNSQTRSGCSGESDAGARGSKVRKSDDTGIAAASESICRPE